MPEAISLSAAIVRFLKDDRQLATNRAVAEFLELSESYICRVDSGELNFTVPYLQVIEQKLGLPLPEIITRAAADFSSAVPLRLRPAYEKLMVALESSGQLRNELQRRRKVRSRVVR